MIFKFDHWSVVNWAVTVVSLFVIVEFTELVSDLLNFFVVIVLLTVFIVVSTHAGIVLHTSDFLSSQETSEISLDLNDESQLLNCIVSDFSIIT